MSPVPKVAGLQVLWRFKRHRRSFFLNDGSARPLSFSRSLVALRIAVGMIYSVDQIPLPVQAR